MDTLFLLNKEDRASFLARLMDSLRCSYICLWSSYTHSPHPNNFLMSSDGVFHEAPTNINEPSSSSGSTLACRLFDEYRQLPFFLDEDHERVPGVAFKNNVAYIELNEANLHTMALSQVQLQFYQQARIKTAVFMGCRSGEMELGFTNLTHANLEMEIKKWFPEDYFPLQEVPPRPLIDPTAMQSSSSSSLRSLSMDSTTPDTTSSSLPPLPPIPSQTWGRTQLQTIDSEDIDAAMTRAYLAVLTSQATSSDSTLPITSQQRQNIAFRKYNPLSISTSHLSRERRVLPSMFKRAISYYRRMISSMVSQQEQSRAASSSQVHHMISERRRREKLNESFQALKALLPSETRKDKASVLMRTREYLSSLKAQVLELIRRNQQLESELSSSTKEAIFNNRQEPRVEASSSSRDEAVSVRIVHVPESTSEERIVELRVTIRGECSVVDVVMRMLEFLRQVSNVDVISMEANAHRVVESSALNRLVLGLKIEEGSEWDESAFVEAVKRVVADMAR